MKIRLCALRLNLITSEGSFGTTALFKSGLNVIRAENTSGKSALMNSILYALGTEVLVGKKGVEALKPVLWSVGDYKGVDFGVIESFVDLEVANGAGEVITIRRYIKGDRDSRLIEVIHAPLITGTRKRNSRVESFFVGMEGAAQRELGFHSFFADFFDLSLPLVHRFRGEDVPLYVECIAPLFFIEQNRGWSGIQSTLPQSFGIRNVSKLAVEYTLGLEVIENEMKRIQIAEEAGQVRENWKGILEQMGRLASRVGGVLLTVPAAPVVKLEEDPWVCISPDGDGDGLSIEDSLVAKRSALIERSEQGAVDVLDRNDEAKLDSKENELMVVQAELAQLRSDLRSEEGEVVNLEKRIGFIASDIQRNRDIKRLRDFGVSSDLKLAQDVCPTCNQGVSDSLIQSGLLVMSIEDNIQFLKAEEEAIRLLLSAGKKRIERLVGRKSVKRKVAGNLRSVVRDLKSDLLKTREFSATEIREQIHLEEEVSDLEKLRNEFDNELAKLKQLSEKWRENRVRYSQLPGEYFSKEDRAKLSELSELFSSHVKKFGYRSTGISDLRISEDNYRPICDEFEVAFGASASDNIRLIWAYSLALLDVSMHRGGNHWGVILFDEPEQQKMNEASSDALYKQIANIKGSEDFQVIVATSASVKITKERLKGISHSLLEFGNKVVGPVVED